MRLSAIAIATSLCLAVPGALFAGPFADFEADLRQAYGTYRGALFKTNMGDAEASTRSMDMFSVQWAGLVETWKASPPPQYEDDIAYAGTLDAVSAIAETAAGQIGAGDLAEAHETLEEIRDALGALHMRNGQVGFSDRMNAYHAYMEHVLMAGYAKKGPEALSSLAGDSAVLSYLANDVVANPAPEADDPAYGALLDGFSGSVQALAEAVAAGDWETAKAAVAGLKKPYAKLFLKFG